MNMLWHFFRFDCYCISTINNSSLFWFVRCNFRCSFMNENFAHKRTFSYSLVSLIAITLLIPFGAPLYLSRFPLVPLSKCSHAVCGSFAASAARYVMWWMISLAQRKPFMPAKATRMRICVLKISRGGWDIPIPAGGQETLAGYGTLANACFY